MDLRQKVLNSLAWVASLRFLGQLITWAMNIIVIRLLTPEDYGLMAIATISILFFTTLSEFGIGASVIQRQDINESILQQLFGLLLVINFCLFCFIWLTAPLIAAFFKEQRAVFLIRFLSIQFIFMGFATIPRSLIYRRMDFKKLSFIEFTSAILGSATTLMLALIGWGVWALAIGNLIMNVYSTIIFNLILSYFYTPRFSIKGMRQFISFGGYITMNGILWFFFNKADIFIIGKIIGKETLGFYSVAMHLASLPMVKATPIINEVAFPAYSRIQNDFIKVSTYFLKVVRMVSLLLFPVSWGISSITPELVAVLLGDKWQMSIVPLQLLSLIIPIYMIRSLMFPPVLALGRPDILFLNSLLAAVLFPLGVLIGVNWGLFGVSLAWVLVFPIVFLSNLFFSAPVLKIRPLDVLRAMAKPALASSIMYATVMALKIFYGGNPKAIGNLILLIVSGAIVFCGMTMIFNKDGYRELLALLRTEK